MPADAAYDVFLSYARADDDPHYDDPTLSFVRRLYDALTAAGLRVWWDRECMPARALDFTEEIRAAVDASERLLLVLGAHVFGDAAKDVKGSPYVQKEVEHARTYCKGINPILRAGTHADYPADLLGGDVPDFTDDSRFDAQIARLIRQLGEPLAPLCDLHGVPLLPNAYIRRHAALDELERKVLADADNTLVISA